MQLKYVGDLPIVSKNGVGFDHTQPDKYMYLHAAGELLEALSYGATQTTKHLYNARDKDISSSELMKVIKKHVKNIDEVFVSCDDKAHDFVHSLVDRVKANDSLSIDERTAWLENIKIMRAYYYQYVINQSAYKAALEALGDEIHHARIKEVSVPMFKNYGMVLSDLVEVLEKRKSPIDSQIKIEQKEDELLGSLYIQHSQN